MPYLQGNRPTDLVVLCNVLPIVNKLQFEDIRNNDFDLWFLDVIRFLSISTRAQRQSNSPKMRITHRLDTRIPSSLFRLCRTTLSSLSFFLDNGRSDRADRSGLLGLLIRELFTFTDTSLVEF